VELTKQSRKMNALIVSSEYAYPYRLRHNNFFNTTNLSFTFFAGEVPPGRMRELLRNEWGLGPRLSDVFLGFYGGHVHMASEALAWLERCLDGFECDVVAPDGVAGAIARCLEEDDAAGSMKGMLTAIAERGFAPLSHEGDPCAQALSLANVAGVVKTSGTVVGLPQEFRVGVSYGVVPASHFMVRPLPPFPSSTTPFMDPPKLTSPIIILPHSFIHASLFFCARLYSLPLLCV
jgi:hypothetical protein